jgi:uncharacterized protein
MTAWAFEPHPDLARSLIPHALGGSPNGAHDLSHLHRVWRNVLAIRRDEGGDTRILLAATVLHDCVAVEKNAPERRHASRLAARKASGVLEALGWPARDVAAVAHAIEAHSFSAGITPETVEARVLQDADRLDALGALGIARCFYIAGRMESALYDPEDPDARSRPLNDTRFTLDHFRTKLLGLASGFRTRSGAQLAMVRHDRVSRFLADFRDELGLRVSEEAGLTAWMALSRQPSDPEPESRDSQE